MSTAINLNKLIVMAMNILKKTTGVILACMLALGLSMEATAQTKQEAIAAYNKAFEFAKNGKYSQAVAAYEETIAICEELGEEGNDIKEKAQSKLPRVNFRLAADTYKEFKNDQSIEKLNTAVDEFKNAVEIAQKYNDTEIANKAQNVITSLYYTKSIIYFKQDELEKSLAALDNSIESNRQYAKAYYQRGMVYKKLDSLDKALKTWDKAIQLGLAQNDNQIVRKTEKAAHDELVYRGVQKMENKKYDESISLLEKALEYNNESEDAYFRLAEVYNKQARWDLAISHANKSLKYESGSKTDRAKIYYELGLALKNKGNKSAACDAFSQAAYGSFQQSAEHEMEYELKCDQLSQSN